MSGHELDAGRGRALLTDRTFPAWLVIATVTMIDADGWRRTAQVPGFIIPAGAGIGNADNAEAHARTIIDPLRLLDCTITVRALEEDELR